MKSLKLYDSVTVDLCHYLVVTQKVEGDYLSLTEANIELRHLPIGFYVGVAKVSVRSTESAQWKNEDFLIACCRTEVLQLEPQLIP